MPRTVFQYYPSGPLSKHGALLFRYKVIMGHYLSMGQYSQKCRENVHFVVVIEYKYFVIDHYINY